jgi:hypothetical protein
VIKKIKKNMSRLVEVFYLPYGVDTDFDDECDRSLLRFLDVVYYTLLAFIVGVPVSALITLAVQK